MPNSMMHRPTTAPSINEDEVIRLASSGSPAPQARATKAVVPTPMAISSACRAKNTRCPAPTAATDGAPMLPTNFVCTKATLENMRLEAMEGTANCQMVGRLRCFDCAVPSSMVVKSLSPHGSCGYSDMIAARYWTPVTSSRHRGSNRHRRRFSDDECQQQIVCRADRQPGGADQFGGAVHFVQHVKDD